MNNFVIVSNHDCGINIYGSEKFEEINPRLLNYMIDSIDELELLKNTSSLIKQKIKYEKIRVKQIIDNYIADTITNEKNNFRCWVLPNGNIYSQSANHNQILNHGMLVEIFFEGLKEFDEKLYTVMIDLYQKYRENVSQDANVEESFAVEVLGWMQVSSNNMYKYVAYRGENWQDKLLWPLFTNYDFKFLISNNKYCQDSKFFQLYDHIDEIIDLGLQKSKKITLNTKKSSVL